MADELRPGGPHSFGAPDPSLATKEEIREGRAQTESLISRNRIEAKEWVDKLQVLMERDLAGAVRNIETRLGGSDTALTAAMKAADNKAEQQALNFSAVLTEAKVGIGKQLDGLNEKIDTLRTSVVESGGQQRGIGQAMTAIIALLALAASVIASILSATGHH